MADTGRAWYAVAALLLLAAPLAGCIGQAPSDAVPEADDAKRRTYSTEKGWSTPTTPRKYEIQPGRKRFVASFDGTEIAIGLFFPEIDGCDFNASQLPERCRFPVVMDAGPYYLDGVAEPSLRPPIVEWLTPRGYVTVQMSLRGTGESGGCFKFKNPADVRDVGAVVEWLADQPWSNGQVGMIGRSYDGTSAWAGAASGAEHLETIVPISGAMDGPHLYYKNGTSELRGFAQPTFYYLFAYGLIADDPSYRVRDWPSVFCPEAAEDWIRGPKAGATGDASSDYWQSRDMQPKILDNFDGSAWVIHGLKDFNVNPSQAVPFTSRMRDAGIETRVWLGQWEHHYPDRVDEHRNVRWDWADKLLTWFDFYLKDKGERPWLGVEVEDSLYVWRKEPRYPPPDADPTPLALSADLSLTPPGEAEEGSFVLTGPPSGLAVSGDVAGAGGPHAILESDPLAEDLHVAGLPKLHVDFEPTTPAGGQLFAELYDVWPDGTETRIGWAAMHLRYHDGGNTDPATLVPGQQYTARMRFEPLDAHVAEGHRLKLVLHKAGVADIVPSKEPEPTTLRLGPDSRLILPTIDGPDTARAPERAS